MISVHMPSGIHLLLTEVVREQWMLGSFWDSSIPLPLNSVHCLRTFTREMLCAPLLGSDHSAHQAFSRASSTKLNIKSWTIHDSWWIGACYNAHAFEAIGRLVGCLRILYNLRANPIRYEQLGVLFCGWYQYHVFCAIKRRIRMVCLGHWLVACSTNATQADFALESQADQQTILFAATALK